MPPEKPVVGVGSWIERRARVTPAAVALVHGDRAVTYAELAGRIRSLAGGLRDLGVTHGDRVAWLGSNHPAFLEALFASALLGAAIAPVNHLLEPGAIRSILEDVEPAVLVHHGPFEPESTPVSIPARVAIGPSEGTVDLESLATAPPGEPIESSVAPDDLCFLAQSSGTTGRPKGIELTHANLTWNVVNFLTSADFRRDDVTVAVAPFFRVGGTGVNVLPVLFMGGTVVVPDETSAEEILRVMATHHVTVGFGNPDALDALTRVDAWPRADLSSLRFIVTGGAPVPERLLRTYLERGVTVLQGYGLSEAAPLALLLDPARALDKIGSAGKPPLLVDVRIEAPDGGDARAGETGELLVRGPNVMAGYWRRPDATRETLSADGWLRTGDAARSDDEGYIWIVDRVVDAFRSAGRTVYPGDVERVLLRHPSIADAGVTSVETEDGPTVVALVVPADGADVTAEEVLAFGRSALAAHEAPAGLLFVGRLPRNSVGKLARAELRRLASSSAAGEGRVG